MKNSARDLVSAMIESMPPVESKLSLLEEAVLRAICETHPADRTALEAQLSRTTVLRRENTGAGVYTDFSVERTAKDHAIGGERMRSGPAVSVKGLKHGMGFILWLKDGYAHHLEGYSYGESTTGIDFEQVGFEFVEE